MFLSRILAAIALMLAVPTATLAGSLAAPPTTTLVGKSDTTLFAGLSWTFGSRGQGVEGILGVAYGDIDVDEDVTGAKLSAHFGFTDGFSFDKIKLTGLIGDDDAQAELGFGYSFKIDQPFAVAGVNGEFVAVGADIFFDQTYEGYLTLHSIGKLSLDEETVPAASDDPIVGDVIDSPIFD
ncbi:hypothetical protein [Tateyamaria sp. Alg231-49]|uniref:hypothetical protein n=1 Tax=Tateyamaria sp. Alg231-49 TaxID=1922219 RepID=UPI000D55F036|nr:hypothetical protein [Tateyamaria sp. Alg231-49]